MGHRLRNSIFPTARSLLIRSSLRLLTIDQHQSVLIVGAGEDPYRSLFGNPRRYVRLDLVNYPGQTDVIANANLLPFAPNSFDFLLASEVMEHLANPTRFAAESLRVLKPGGKLVVTVPFMFHHHPDPDDYWRLTPDGFRQVLSEFSSVTISSQGNRLHVLSDLITTSFSPRSLFAPLRISNHIFRLLPLNNSRSSAPSGFLVTAVK